MLKKRISGASGWIITWCMSCRQIYIEMLPRPWNHLITSHLKVISPFMREQWQSMLELQPCISYPKN
nr:hypothetical protein B456_009G193000 [Ipomoea batatas]